MPFLESLNLNNNKIMNVYQTVDRLAGLESFQTLFINLVTEEEVDYVLKKLPRLAFLNGLGVDRDELYMAAQAEADQQISFED
jgi:hypothetical protein